jgi:hypothetical protein
MTDAQLIAAGVAIVFIGTILWTIIERRLERRRDERFGLTRMLQGDVRPAKVIKLWPEAD